MDEETSELADDSGSGELTITPLDPQQPSGGGRARAVGRWIRSRTGRLALSALCVLVALGALVGLLVGYGATPTSVQIALGLVTPTATSPLPLGGDAIIAYNTVPWATITANGRKLTLSQQHGYGYGFTLARGSYHIVYKAQHFPTLRCVISVPTSQRDNCPLFEAANPNSGYGGALPIVAQRFIDFGSTPSHLSRADAQALDAAVAQALAHVTESAPIAPGERYLNAQGQTLTATTPLTFTLSMALASTTLTPATSADLADQEITANPRQWPIVAPITPSYGVSAGAASPPPNTMTPLLPSYHDTAILNVTLSENTGWAITGALVGGDLNSLMLGFLNVAASMIPRNVSAASFDSWGETSEANVAVGAVIMFDASATPNANISVLWRFGVYYALNAATAAIFPSLPVAGSDELALANSITSIQG